MINMYDVIIIGSGPAGISTALYTKRGGLTTLIISKGISSLQKAQKIGNYYGIDKELSGEQLYKIGLDQAKKLEVEIVEDEVTQIIYENEFKVITVNSEYAAKKVVIATGANRKMPTIKGIKQIQIRVILQS